MAYRSESYMKNRYFIFMSYKGTAYHGWQIQPGAPTVQAVIEKSLSLILGENIAVTGAGRTDTGVHASFYCAHFDTEKADLEDDNRFIFKLNRILPDDIAVNTVKKVYEGSNARYSAISRTYKYYVSRKKDPFTDWSSWYLHGHLGIDSMNEACRLLLSHSDFTTFSKLHSGSKTNICKVYSALWEEDGDQLVFTIKADRFLRNMVRAIVGTMADIGFGKMSPGEFDEIIQAKNRGLAGMSAPAKGLFLTDIEYPSELFAPQNSTGISND